MERLDQDLSDLADSNSNVSVEILELLRQVERNMRNYLLIVLKWDDEVNPQKYRILLEVEAILKNAKEVVGELKSNVRPTITDLSEMEAKVTNIATRVEHIRSLGSSEF